MNRTSRYPANRHRLRNWLIALLILALLALVVLLLIHRANTELLSDDELSRYSARMTDPEFIQRGEYLARAGDCIACHMQDENQPFAGGVAFATPFGMIYSSNITPDQETGIGSWTHAEFVRAMQKGVDDQGHYLYPAFPYTSYTKLSLEDTLAIKAYLDTLEPIAYQPPANKLQFPFSIRSLMLFWNFLFLDEERLEPNPQESEPWNRGHYLVEALGHCGDCHTPRNLLQGLSDKKFAGADIQGWHAYNITPDPNAGIGSWSDEELVSYLETGIAPGRATAGGPMAEVVEYSTRFLTRQDQQAIVTYLRSIEPVASGAEQPRSQQGQPAQAVTMLRGTPIEDQPKGDRLFLAHCASCHGWSGTGAGGHVVGSYPSLINNSDVGARDTQNLLQVILHGVERQTDKGPVFMPAFRDLLSDQQVADLANYVVRQFGNPDSEEISLADVQALRGKQEP